MYETFSHSLCQSSPGSATENTTIPSAVESSTILRAYSYAAVFSSYLTAFVATDLVRTKHDSNCIRLYNVVDVSKYGARYHAGSYGNAYSAKMYLTPTSVYTTICISF